jgi:hypothetical protein
MDREIWKSSFYKKKFIRLDAADKQRVVEMENRVIEGKAGILKIPIWMPDGKIRCYAIFVENPERNIVIYFDENKVKVEFLFIEWFVD